MDKKILEVVKKLQGEGYEVHPVIKFFVKREEEFEFDEKGLIAFAICEKKQIP